MNRTLMMLAYLRRLRASQKYRRSDGPGAANPSRRRVSRAMPASASRQGGPARLPSDACSGAACAAASPAAAATAQSCERTIHASNPARSQRAGQGPFVEVGQVRGRLVDRPFRPAPEPPASARCSASTTSSGRRGGAGHAAGSAFHGPAGAPPPPTLPRHRTVPPEARPGTCTPSRSNSRRARSAMPRLSSTPTTSQPAARAVSKK